MAESCAELLTWSVTEIPNTFLCVAVKSLRFRTAFFPTILGTTTLGMVTVSSRSGDATWNCRASNGVLIIASIEMTSMKKATGKHLNVADNRYRFAKYTAPAEAPDINPKTAQDNKGVTLSANRKALSKKEKKKKASLPISSLIQ
ncbi:hypothetical protein INP83_10855 [Mucilaginibacter sp. 21P]|uniref:hypothetical protein n=1 Tax=Mucilaginibacter sp. 21P TaxID=2778902 RepID=UPI001C57125E|nr:hypothetical protein [Mucilaginibacter sp. 21P]QXV63617.1 hypothetical protein INP83_10855 [Mucilaginibacter sp. 21P]